MSNESNLKPGSIFWRDLTVGNAEQVRDFYASVVGWQPRAHSMEEYEDFDMLVPGSSEVVTGICHARGDNANLPPQWLMYIMVADVEQSVAHCRELGGKVLDGPRQMGDSKFCVIQDPAGAVCALFQANG